MRIACIIVVAAAFAAPAPAAAQSPSAGPRPPDAPVVSMPDLFGSRSKPAKPAALPSRPLPAVATLSDRPPDARVVCGMTLVPADPQHDAKIRHRPPADSPAFTVRSIEPRMCQR